MKTFKSYKDESRKNWGKELEEGQSLNSEQIKVGALLRIAEASELMAKNHLKLQEDYEYMRKQRDRYKEAYEFSQRSAASYKVQITKLKKQLKNLNNEKS